MNQDLTKGPVTNSMLLFAVPMILGDLLQQRYNIADSLKSPLISVSGLFLFLPLLHLCDVIGAFFIPERWSKKTF